MLRLRLSAAFLVGFALVQVGTAQQPDAGASRHGEAGAQSPPPRRTGRPAHGRPAPQGDTPAAGVPRRHQLRPRRRHRHRQESAAGHRSHAGRLRGARGRQAAVDRAVPADQGRRQPEAGRAAAAQIRNRNDEELEAARDDVRMFVFFLDDYHVRHGNSISVTRAADPVHPEAAAARRHGRRSCIR